jgi:O-antigen ligase
VKRHDGITLAIGAIALLTSVLAVGGAIRAAQAAVAGLVALTIATQVLARRSIERAPLMVLIGLATALTALQLVPLPDALLSTLDATGSQLRADGAAIAHTNPWHSISLDPAATLRALAFFITLLGVAAVSLRFAASERGRFLLLGAVAITCGIAAIVTGVHTLLSADALYGIYEPMHLHDAPVFGPLLNPNHLGGLMAIGAVLAVGLAFYERQPTQARVLWLVIATGCTIVAAASLSRGAIIGLVIGVVVCAALLVAGRLEHRRRRSWRNDVPIALVIGLGVALALYASAGNVADQLQDTSLTELSRPVSKYEAWKSSLRLVRESPWVGVGRGATEATLTRVHPASAYFTFSHLENEYLTTIVEWGIPGAFLLALAFAWCVTRTLRRWRDGPLAAGAIGALTAILFQSSVDFGIELLGIAVPATIIASTVQLVPLRPSSHPLRDRASRSALVLALLCCAGVLVLPMTRSIAEDHDAILAMKDPQLPSIRASIERHPLDYYGFGIAADVQSRAGDIHAVEYLNQALALHPTHPGLHRLAARMLIGNKRYAQAAVEYALAMNADAAPRALLNEIVMLLPNADYAADAIPTDYPNIDVMLHTLTELKRSDLSEKWLARVARRPQHDLRVIDMLYDLAMARGDVDVARQTAELRLDVSHTTTSRLMLAKVKLAQHEYDALLTELADVKNWTGRIDEKADAWLILCDVHIAREQWDPALECLHRLDSSGMPLSGGRVEITKRLQEIGQKRAYEAKMQAATALEKSLGPPAKK